MHSNEFWQRVITSDYAVSGDVQPLELLPELLEMLGSPDPFVRDKVAYHVLAHWFMRDQFSDATKREVLAQLEAKLALGLGENGTETVFSRSFACLIFALLLSLHNEKPYLEAAQIDHLLELALDYFAREQDLRGFEPGQGWVHAVAHCADWLDEHANAEGVSAAQLSRILEALARKTEVEGLYLFDEEDRMAYAAARVIHRQLIGSEAVEAWARNLAARVSLGDEQKSNRMRRHNAKVFLRSVHFFLDELGSAPSYLKAIRDGLGALSL